MNKPETSGFLVISLDENQGCLLSAARQEVVDKIARVAEESLQNNLIGGVLVLQQGIGTDYSEEWEHQVSEKLFRIELEFRIKQLAEIVENIGHSRCPWVYAFAGDCLGSFFCFSRNFTHILCFNRQVRLGIPEARSGLIWPHLVGKKVREQEIDWLALVGKNAVFSTEEVANLNGFDLLMDCEDWQKMAKDWMRALLAGRLQISPSPTPENRKLKNESDRNDADVNNFELVRNLARNRSIDHQALINLTARIVFSRSYMSQLIEDRCLSVRKDFGGVVHIELNGYIPPTGLIIALLHRPYGIVFFSDNCKNLERGLCILKDRLRVAIGSEGCHHLWIKANWMVIPRWPRGLVFAFISRDRIVMAHDGRRIHFLRVSEKSECVKSFEILEILNNESTDFPTPISDLCKYISDRLFDGKSNFPIVYLVRSLILTELIACCGHNGEKFADFLRKLQDSGWGFASQEEEWRAFLADRHAYLSEEVDQKLARFSIPREHRQIATWRQLEAAVGAAVVEGKRVWDKASLNRHLSLFCLLISRLLEKTNNQTTRRDFAFFVSRSVGMPRNFGQLPEFGENLGRRFCNEYFSEYWSSLSSLNDAHN